MIFDRVAPLTIPGWLRALGALAAGVFVGAGFAPFSAWPLLLCGIAGFTLLVAGVRLRTAAGLGYLFGIGCCLVSISWLHGLGIWVAALLVLWMSLYFLAYGIGVRLVLRLPLWPVWSAFVWMLMEFVYSRWPFGGFGWIRLGYASVDTPVSGVLRLVGLSGTSLVVALLCAMLAWTLAGDRPSNRGQRMARGIALAAVLVIVGASGGVTLTNVASASRGLPTIGVGVVQGNVDGANMLEPFGRARSVTNNHLSETVTLMSKVRTGKATRPDFVVWPENSTDIDPSRDAETASVIKSATTFTAVPILVGSVMDGPGRDERQTAGLWWTSTNGVTQRYYKRNLVPFGEYIPLRSFLLPKIPILERTGAQSVPGTAPGIFQARNVQGQQVFVGDLICFELAYDATVYSTITAGAQVLVVQSNNASYGGTPQVPQQWNMTRARAIETGRDVAVATTDSYSGFIRADGSVVWRSKEFTSASSSAQLNIRNTRTPAITYGPVITVGSAVVGAIAVVAGIVGSVLQRRRSASRA